MLVQLIKHEILDVYVRIELRRIYVQKRGTFLETKIANWSIKYFLIIKARVQFYRCDFCSIEWVQKNTNGTVYHTILSNCEWGDCVKNNSRISKKSIFLDNFFQEKSFSCKIYFFFHKYLFFNKNAFSRNIFTETFNYATFLETFSIKK